MAVYGCLRILSTSFGQLPIRVYKRLDGGGKEPLPDHPVNRILHVSPNDEQDPIQYKENVAFEQARMGNSYSEIVRDGTGRPAAVHHLDTDRVTVDRDESRTLRYKYRVDADREVILRAEDVLHVKLFGNGPVGKSPITVAREAIGADLAAEQHGSSFFGQGANPSLILTHPGVLKDAAHRRLQESVTRKYGGPSNAGKPMILEEGTKVEKLTETQRNSQFLETRGFNVDQICRLYGVPPHMLARLDRATFSNIEHLAIEFVVFTLGPYLIRFEQQCDRKLLLNDPKLFCKFNFDALLRGDVKSRNEAYSVARQWGWLSADEIREREDMNPLPKGQGKIFLTPMNMIPADQAGKMMDDPEPGAPPADEPEDDDEDRAIHVLCADAERRVRQNLVDGLERVAKGASAESVFKSHTRYLRGVVTPLLQAFSGLAVVDEVVSDCVSEFVVKPKRRALSDDPGAIEKVIEEVKTQPLAEWMVSKLCQK